MQITPLKHTMVRSALLTCTLAALTTGCGSDDGASEAEQQLQGGSIAPPVVTRSDSDGVDQGPAIVVDRDDGFYADGAETADGPRIVDVTRSDRSGDERSVPSVTRTVHNVPTVTRPDAPTATRPEVPSELEPSDRTVTEGHARNGRFLAVAANGAGCPAGSWKAALAADGQSFTVTLDGYEASLTPTSALAVADCQLAIDLGANVSYAVTSFGFEGTAKLGQGVAAVANASFAFQGDPTTGLSTTKQLVGPHDGKFSVQGVVPSNQLRWSECGVARDLNFRTRVRLTSGVSEGSGTVSVASLGGAIGGDQALLGVRFALRSCADAR